MADRPSVHQPRFEGGRMVPYRQSADPVLLPYEKQLIDSLGCTEEEYKEFVRHLQHKAYARPAGYDHVPDVNATGLEPWLVSTLISLAVGAVLQVAAYFLTPKPKAPRDVTQLQLGGADGASRFSPNSGFDSSQNLASYGTPVPIVFTKRVQLAGQTSGGVLISPALVWSRLKSWGSFQVLELVAVAGQGVMDKPDRSGLFLGNNAIDGIFESDFQFYWNNGSASNSRLYGLNLRYGTLETPAIPGPQNNAFITPTSKGVEDTGFCGAFTPTNQTKFGVYQGIPNGTPYRPNWEVVSVPKSQSYESKEQLINNQQKYVSRRLIDTHPFGGGLLSNYQLSKAGMPGTGVNYARHVGIISHNGFQVPNPTAQIVDGLHLVYVGDLTAIRKVTPGDIIEVVVGYGRQNRQPFALFGNNSAPLLVDDIVSAKDNEAEQFDAAMVKGQVYMIGRTTWQVIERDNRIYTPGNAPIIVKMRCLDAWSVNQNVIGLVAPSALSDPNCLWERDIPEVFYPILRVDFAHVRNNRPCDVTEIGIRSQVWARFNGITNFNTIPTPFELQSYNNKDTQVREGRNTSYARRTSFFALDVRPADNEITRNATTNDGFTFLGLFAVSGSAPQDIYSFIRITHPSNSLFEYRMRPFNSAIFALQSGGGDEDVLELNGAGTPFQERTVTTYLGTFKIGGRGKYIKPKDYFTHSQMAVRPEQIGVLQYGQWTEVVSGVEFLGAFRTSDGQPAAWNTLSNMMSSARGLDPYFDNLPVGFTTTLENWTYDRDAPKVAVMRIRLRAYERSLSTTARNKWWEITSTEVVTFTGNWVSGEQFIKRSTTIDGVQHDFRYRVSTRSAYQNFDTPQSATRIFETYSGIAEVSHYGDLITRSCDNGPEHEIVYVNESIAEDTVIEYDNLAMTGLKLRSSNSLQTLDQLRCYMREGVQVELLTDGGNGASNLFTDLVWYLATNKDIGVGNIISPELLDRDQLAETGRYLRANRLFFDDVIADSINLRSYISEKTASLLCYAVIKNGKLSVAPALPVGSDYKITTGAPKISAMFTDGNIIEDSFQLEWLELEERKMFQAAVIFSRRPLNQLTRQETVVVRYDQSGSADLPIEEFNLPHVSNVDHAILAAKYFLSLRKHVTHSITFKTLPYGLALAPGDYIAVAVEMSPYNPSNNGVIQPDGTVVSVLPLADGTYTVNAWERSSTEVVRTSLTITGGIATNLRNSVFSVVSSNVTKQVYQVDALDIDQDGIVTVKATNFPVDTNNRSLIALDVLSSSAFNIIGEGGPV
jgi:hypothetical protein